MITSGAGSKWFCTETDAETARTPKRTIPTRPEHGEPWHPEGAGAVGLARPQAQRAEAGDGVDHRLERGPDGDEHSPGVGHRHDEGDDGGDATEHDHGHPGHGPVVEPGQ